MVTLRGALARALLFLLPAPALTGAQAMADDVACAGCAIVVRDELTIGGADGALTGPPGSVLRDGRGRIWIVDGNLPRVFGSDGKRIAFGRSGSGPSEFRSAVALFVIPGDSVVVVDGVNRRATVVGPDLRPARAISLQVPVEAATAVRWPDHVIVSATIRNRLSSTWPLHRISFAGDLATVTSSFGISVIESRTGAEAMHHLSGGHTGEVWALHRWQYAVSAWDSAGRQVNSFERKPSWFTNRSQAWIGNPTTAPPPMMNGVQRDAAGQVWVYAFLPAREWKQAWPGTSAGAGEMRAASIQFEKLFTTTIEVIDPRSRRVLVRRSFEQLVWPVAGGGAAFYSVGPDGEPKLTIAALSVTRG